MRSTSPLAFRPACGQLIHPPHLRPDKNFAQETIFAPCEGMIVSPVNRTKMFHVKHFGTREKTLNWRAPLGNQPS